MPRLRGDDIGDCAAKSNRCHSREDENPGPIGENPLAVLPIPYKGDNGHCRLYYCYHIDIR